MMGKGNIFTLLEKLDGMSRKATSSKTIMQPKRSRRMSGQTSGAGVASGSYSFAHTSAWKADETKVMSLLNSLTNEISPLGKKCHLEEQRESLKVVHMALKNSSLISVISAHLRNDSVLDIAGHVPIYRVILELLRSIAAVPQFWFLFVSGEGDSNISKLLAKLEKTVTQYSQLLEASKTKDLEIAQLASDIKVTLKTVEEAREQFMTEKDESLKEAKTENLVDAVKGLSQIAPMKTMEDRYVQEMRKLQFAFHEIIGDGDRFKVPFQFEKEACGNLIGIGHYWNPSRTKRLAQESAMLSTSLPLSYKSSIFLRCDHDRLDVIKVLITGPQGTPHSNGCFELDIFLPLDYPNSPPKVKFVTGGKCPGIPHVHSDGSICLTLLNTWRGDNVERWNPKTSSLLPVLVAIQSFILAEMSFDHINISLYTVQYAMLDQIKNPSPCFKEVIHRHFWMKRNEILAQCEQLMRLGSYSWTMEGLTPDSSKKVVSELKSQLLNMSPPGGLKNWSSNPPGPIKGSREKKGKANKCVLQ